MSERRVWVLDTSTKGTGAQMVPLEDTVAQPAKAEQPLVSPRMRRAPRRPEEPRPRAPRRFRVVDVMTRRVLSGDADVRTTLAVLGEARRSVDVAVHVWEPAREDWRLLTLREQAELWRRRTPADR
ncbi:MAG TPA: hypothetical protein VN213_00560 [Solirubrobacteraceae bacterium]|nr:hypothetical protein [Solirubrobacteraceae bacterium]